MHSTSDCVRANYGKLQTNEKLMFEALDMLKDIKADMKKYIFHMNMESQDISEFFPLKNAGDLERFMDRGHKDWQERKTGFYHLLYTTISPCKKKFSTAFLHTVFTRKFIKNNQWPGYNF